MNDDKDVCNYQVTIETRLRLDVMVSAAPGDKNAAIDAALHALFAENFAGWVEAEDVIYQSVALAGYDYHVDEVIEYDEDGKDVNVWPRDEKIRQVADLLTADERSKK
jgi:hypothetical protein